MDTSNPMINFSLAKKEYSGLITFVEKTPPPGKHQLSHFLYPFCVHIYLLLLKDKKLLEAQRFVSVYSEMFLKTEGYAEIIQELVKFRTFEEVESHSYFNNFCEYKYKVKISEDNIKLLKDYLEHADCKILSHILQRKLNIEVIEDQSSHAQTSKVPSTERKESASQANQRSENRSSTQSINVKNVSNGLSSRFPCFSYTISCRNDQLCCVDINHKNTLLACGFENSGIYVWNLDPSIVKFDSNESKGCLPRDFGCDNVSSPSLRCVLNGHSGGVYGVSYASGLLMSCSEDTTARAWSMTDFTNLYAYNHHKYPIWDIAIHPNSGYFATASHDCTACLWSLKIITPLRIFVGHDSDVDQVKFHSNCRYVATSSADKTIKLWAIEDGQSVRNFPGHDTHINTIAFSPDGKHIASADDNGCIKIWDLASGKLHSEIAAHSRKILSISYSTDSSFIASCSFDQSIKIWDVKQSSSSINDERKNEAQSVPLVESYFVDSLPHYVGFRQKNVLISVGTQMRTEN